MAVRTVVVTHVIWDVNQFVLDAVVHALEHAQGRVIHVHTVAAHAAVHVVAHARNIAVVAVLAEGLAQAIVLGSVLRVMDVLPAVGVMVLVVLDVIQVATLVLLSRHKQFKYIGGDLIGN